MKLLIIFSLYIFCYTTSLNSQNKFLLLFDDDNLLKEVTDYSNRVKTSGGKVLELGQFNNQIKFIKDSNYFDSLLFWISLSGGVKTQTDTISILFDLKGNDLTHLDLFPGPLLGKDINTNKFVAIFKGLNSLHNTNFLSDQPFTLILEIKIDSSEFDKCIMSSYINNDYSINVDKKNELTVASKTKLKNGHVDYQRVLLAVNFNGSASSIYVNNILVKSGNLNSVQLVGLLFGMNQKHNPDFFSGYLYTCGIFKSIIPDKFRSELTTLLNK